MRTAVCGDTPSNATAFRTARSTVSAVREGTVGEANRYVLEADVPAAQLVHSGRHAGGLHRVGDEGEAVRALLAVGDAERPLVYVYPVGDDAGPGAVVVQRRPHCAGSAVRERAHALYRRAS